jgi:large subunit ribosomal protein L25
MEKIALTAQVREKAGKGVARELRRNAQIPAVLYSHGKSMPISMGNKEITTILNAEGGKHALLNLTLQGTKEAAERMALIKDYELDPITGKLMHIDLMEVAMDEKVKVQVAIHLTGSAIGVKEGGILQYGLHQVEIECLPQQIPSHFDVDIAAVKVNESLHVRDIQTPEGVKILNDADATIMTIQPPVSEAKLESMLATGAPAAAAEGEPELVKKPKKEGEAAAAGDAKGKEAAPAKGAAPAKAAAPAAKAAAPKK